MMSICLIKSVICSPLRPLSSYDARGKRLKEKCSHLVTSVTRALTRSQVCKPLVSHARDLRSQDWVFKLVPFLFFSTAKAFVTVYYKLFIAKDISLYKENRTELQNFCVSPNTPLVDKYFNLLKPVGYYTYHQLNIRQFYVLPTKCIYMFCIYLRKNSDLGVTCGAYEGGERCAQGSGREI